MKFKNLATSVLGFPLSYCHLDHTGRGALQGPGLPSWPSKSFCLIFLITVMSDSRLYTSSLFFSPDTSFPPSLYIRLGNIPLKCSQCISVLLLRTHVSDTNSSTGTTSVLYSNLDSNALCKLKVYYSYHVGKSCMLSTLVYQIHQAADYSQLTLVFFNLRYHENQQYVLSGY